MKITVEVNALVMRTEKQTKVFESKVDPPIKCCRCYPAWVSENGFCGCCMWDHAAGVSLDADSPGYFAPIPATDPQPEDEPCWVCGVSGPHECSGKIV